jgi:endo-1,4-beta-xylanase
MSDNISWLQGWKDAKRTDGLPGRPCPYDAQLRAKPMRQAVAAAMIAAPARA